MKASLRRRVPVSHRLLPLAARLLVWVALVPSLALAGEIQIEGADSAAIAAALQRSQHGDTLRLPPGTTEFSETLQMNSGVRLIGAGQDKPLLRIGS
jgi:hypothetical protein